MKVSDRLLSVSESHTLRTAVFHRGSFFFILNIEPLRVCLIYMIISHTPTLKAYANLLDPFADPLCPLCKEEPQTIEHWLQRCPRLDAIRQSIFRNPSLPSRSLPLDLKGSWCSQGSPSGRPLALKPQQQQLQVAVEVWALPSMWNSKYFLNIPCNLEVVSLPLKVAWFPTNFHTIDRIMFVSATRQMNVRLTLRNYFNLNGCDNWALIESLPDCITAHRLFCQII